MSKYNVAIIGATGATGKELLSLLIESEKVEKIYILTRRSTNIAHPKIIETIVDFEHMEQNISPLKLTHAYCCLGTTLKKAGDLDSFRKVDLEYCINFAKLVHSFGCRSFNVISAIGANPKSKNYYNRTKGQLELGLIDLDFHTLNIFRPSLLKGEREDKRVLENIGSFLFLGLDLILHGPLKKYQSITTKFLAKGMLKASFSNNSGTHTLYKNDLE